MKLHLRREIESRVRDSQRRDFDAAAKQFIVTQQRLSVVDELNASVAVKALDGSIAQPAGKSSSKRTAGTGVAERKPEVRFSPSATRKPGQVLKLHVSAAEMIASGDEPNWGWVDPPKDSGKTFDDIIREFNSRPQIVVNYLDKNVRTGDYQEAKALGERIVSTHGDIGSRAARAAGFIVDALGKLRCPPGTPAANQFTNERGENCFSPVAVLKDVASGISNIIQRQHANRASAAQRAETIANLVEDTNNLTISRGLRSRRSRSGRSSTSGPFAGLVFQNENEVLDWWEANPEQLVLMSPQQQIEIRQLIAARKSIAGTPASLQAARDRIDNSLDSLKKRFNVTESELDNADLYALLDAGFDLNDPTKINLDWQEMFTDLAANRLWDPNLSLQENIANRKQIIRQQLLQFLDGQQAIRFNGKKASDALAAGDPDVETVLANMFGYLDSAERGSLKAVFDSLKDAVPGQQSPLVKIDNFIPDDPTIGALTSALGDGQIKISFNKIVALDAWKNEEVLNALKSGRAFNLTAIGPQSDSAKYDEINKALKNASNLYEYLSMMKEIDNVDIARAFHGSLEAAFSQVAFHELNHVDLYALANKNVFDIYKQYGVVTFWPSKTGKPVRLTTDPSTWDNKTWMLILDSTVVGLTENLPDDFPPADLEQFELASLHYLTGAYAGREIYNAVQQRASDQNNPIADVATHRIATVELLAEMAGLQKMGILGGEIVEDILGNIDDAMGRTTPPRVKPVPFAPTIPIPPPTLFDKPLLPGQARPPRQTLQVPSGPSAPSVPNVPAGTTGPNVPNLPISPVVIAPSSTMPVQQAVDDILYVTGDANAHDMLDEMFGFDKTPYGFLKPSELDTRFELLQEEANRLIALGYGTPPYGGTGDKDRDKQQFRLFLALTGMKQIANHNKSRKRLSPQSNSRYRWVQAGKNPNPGKYFDTEYYFGDASGGMDLTDIRNMQAQLEQSFRYNKNSLIWSNPLEDRYNFDLDNPVRPPRPKYRSGGRGFEEIMGTPQNNHVPTRGRNDALKASGTHAIALDSQLTTPQREALTADLQTRSGIFGNVEDLQTAISGSASIRKANGLGVFDVNPPTGKTTGDLIDEELDITIRALEAIDKSKIDQPVKARFVLDGVDSASVGRDDIMQTSSITQGALLSEEQIEVSKTIPHTSDGASAIIHMPTGSSVAFGAEENSSIYDTVTLPPGSFKVVDVDKDGVIHLVPVSQESKDSYLSNLLSRVEALDVSSPGERNEKKRLKKRIYDNLNRYNLDDRADNVIGSQPESRPVGYARDAASSANGQIANSAIDQVYKAEKVQILNTDDGWIQQTFPDGNADESIKTISAFGHKIMTPDARRAETRSANMQRISKLRENLDTGNLLGLNHSDAADVDPQVEDFIRTHTDEDILNFITDAATTYANGFDDRVRVSVNNEQLDELLTSGNMPMFGDKDSSHIGAVQRRELETTLGYPTEASAGARTTSGWIEHSRNDSERLAHIEQQNRLNPEKVLQSADPGLLSNDSGFQPAGNQLNITGDVEIVLRPEVAHRSSWTMGDPIRREDGSYPSKLFGGSPEDILQAMTSSNDDRGIARIHELIRAGITGDWSGIQTAHHLTTPNRGGVTRSEHLATRQGDSSIHIEAIIHGPVNLEHVDYIKMPLSTLEAGSNPKDIRLDPMSMGSKDKRVLDALRSAGLEDYEIDWFFNNSHLFDNDKSSDLRSVINARNFISDIKDRYGVDIRLSNTDGMDILNAETHRELASGVPNGDTAEQVLYDQIRKDLIANAPDWAKRIKEKSSAAGVQPPDKRLAQTVNKPAVNVVDGGDRLTGLASRRTDPAKSAKIIAENKRIIDDIQKSGGSPFFVTPEYKENNSIVSSIFGAKTVQEVYKRQSESTAFFINGVREYLATGKIPVKSTGETISGFQQNKIDRIHPDIKKLILESSDEKIIDIIKQQAVKFHQTVSRDVRVSIPKGQRLNSFLETGRYLTTHETLSSHSGPDIRKAYEQTLGFPNDLESSLRPASAYVVHPDWEESARKAYEQKKGKPVTEFSELDRNFFGPVGIYGTVELVLRPEIAGRTAFGAGDSISTLLRPALFDETDPDAIFSAIMSHGVKFESNVEFLSLGLLDSSRTNSFASLNVARGSMEEDESRIGREYFEALIPGSFTVDDVAEIRISYADLATRVVEPSRSFSGEDAMEQTKKIRDEFYAEDKLRSMGFTDSEIAYIIDMVNQDQHFTKSQINLPAILLDNNLSALLSFREAKKNLEAMKEKGIHVQVLDPSGKNRFDPVSYGADPNEDIEKILLGRFMKDFPDRIRRNIELKAKWKREEEERIASGEERVLRG